MKVIEKLPNELLAAEYNPRKISQKELADLKTSIKKFGMVEPIVVNIHKDRVGVVVGGHQRLKVMKAEGWKKFPCIEVNLNLEDEKELNIRLNKSGGEFDFELLSENFEMEDLLDFGFEDFEILDTTVGSVNKADEDEEWVGTPGFEIKENTLKLVIHFETEKDREAFMKKFPIEINRKQAKVWTTQYPYNGDDDLKNVRFKKND